MGKSKSKVKKKKRRLDHKAVLNGTANNSKEKKKVVKRMKSILADFAREEVANG